MSLAKLDDFWGGEGGNGSKSPRRLQAWRMRWFNAREEVRAPVRVEVLYPHPVA